MLLSCLDLLSHTPPPLSYAILANGVPVSYFAYFKRFSSYFNSKDSVIHLHLIKGIFFFLACTKPIELEKWKGKLLVGSTLLHSYIFELYGFN